MEGKVENALGLKANRLLHNCFWYPRADSTLGELGPALEAHLMVLLVIRVAGRWGRRLRASGNNSRHDDNSTGELRPKAGNSVVARESNNERLMTYILRNRSLAVAEGDQEISSTPYVQIIEHWEE